MKEPKFNLGQKVWAMSSGCVEQRVIKGIYLAPEYMGMAESIWYLTIPFCPGYALPSWLKLYWRQRSFITKTSEGYAINSCQEQALFPTKEVLIASL